MPAVASSPIPAVLAKLGPLDADRIADLRPYLESVPDPRARRGRWYSLTAILLVCAWAVIGGAKSIDEIAEAGERASIALLTALGIRRHLLGWRRSPKPVTIGRVLQALDGDALDQALGAYLTDRHREAASAGPPAAPLRRVIAVDGKAPEGLGPSRCAAPSPALGGHARARRHPRPGRGRGEDERDAALRAAAGATRPRGHRGHLRCPALGEGQHHLAGRDEEGPLHRGHQDQPAHRVCPARRPALDIDQGSAHRLPQRTATGKPDRNLIKAQRQKGPRT